MEINAKKIRCALATNDVLDEINLAEVAESLGCIFLFSTPVTNEGIICLNFYSDEFEEEEEKKSWIILCNKKIEGKRVFEWVK